MTPKISIIIPSFNKVLFIDKTLTSIFDQNYPNLEVVIQDGGSTDGTVAIIKRYMSKHPREIKFESKPDGGQLNGILMGMNKATGDVLTYINADDQYEMHAFDAVSKAYQDNPKSLWFAGRGIVINEKDNEIAKFVTFYKNLFLFLNHKSLILILNYLMQPSVFFTRMAYKKYGPFTGTNRFVMEYDLWLRLGRIQMPIIVDSVISKFRIEATTKTKTLFKDLLKEDEKIVRKYTTNKFILLVHKLNNLGRVLVEKFV